MRCHLSFALIEEVRFAADSPVEEGGFEPSVPLSPLSVLTISGPSLAARLLALA
jgi:hypothetical protein